MSKVVVVNENDEVIGYKDRKDRSDDIIRISALWVINPETHEVLIAQRAFNKIYNPGVWSISVAGTVEEGEDYVSNIVKESEEEIGLHIDAKDLVLGPKKLLTGVNRYFFQVYFYETTLSFDHFTVQKDEVNAIRWITIDELQSWHRESPKEFTSSFKDTLDVVLEYLGK